MTNKLSSLIHAEMLVINVKSIKVTNGENKVNNLPFQVSPKGIWGGGGARDTFRRVGWDSVWELEGST